MADFFFYGTLCHIPLLARVLGRPVAPQPATLAGHAVFWAKDQPFPLLVASPGGHADGLLLRDLGAEDVARLDFYEGGFAFLTRDLGVTTATGLVQARVYLPQPGHWQPGAPWSLTDWQARWGDIVLATAGDFMALYGQRPASEVLARYGSMLVRGDARLRAATPAPTLLRRKAALGDVVVRDSHQTHAGFFATEVQHLSYRQFDGNMGAEVRREVFVSGDAVTVLPYDPQRDRVLLVEQFRMGAFARGDTQPWLLEAIAGRIDPGETPEATARREAVEEAGLTLGDLLPVADYYPTPGAKTEYIYSYVALCDLPDGSAGTFGLAAEAEDIRGHLISFDDLMALLASGEINNAPLVLTALWLANARPRLRQTQLTPRPQ